MQAGLGDTLAAVVQDPLWTSMAGHYSLWLLGFLSLEAFGLASFVSTLPFGGSLVTPLLLPALFD